MLCNEIFDTRRLIRGGATEMVVSDGLHKADLMLEGTHQDQFLAVGEATEAIPRTLVQNYGMSVIQTMTHLKACYTVAYKKT